MFSARVCLSKVASVGVQAQFSKAASACKNDNDKILSRPASPEPYFVGTTAVGYGFIYDSDKMLAAQ